VPNDRKQRINYKLSPPHLSALQRVLPLVLYSPIKSQTVCCYPQNAEEKKCEKTIPPHRYALEINLKAKARKESFFDIKS
jgi:hypothetical protein